MMKRDLMLKLIEWKEKTNRRPLILEGARQVGKTYLLKEFGKKYFSKVHYFNFEEDFFLAKTFERDLNPERIIDELSVMKDRSINKKEDLIIFDEIQACPNALTSLKYFEEQCPEIALCAAGSLLGVRLGEGSYPVGKVDHLHLYPLSFFEFVRANNQQLYNYLMKLDINDEISDGIHGQLWDIFRNYLIVGGLPGIVNIYISKGNLSLNDLFNNIREEQLSLIKDYLSDIAKHSGKTNAMHIERVWRSIPAQLSKSMDGQAKKFIFKNVLSGRSGYSNLAGPIEWLEKAGLIHKVLIAQKAIIPLTAYTKENIFKLLFFDIGILAALANIPAQSFFNYSFGTYKGFVAENFVATELINSGLKNLYSWNEGTSEIEFLIQSGENLIPIEVKAGKNTQAKSLKVFSQRYDPLLKIILSGKKQNSSDNLKYIPLYFSGFIKNYLEHI